eukprot:CAMPEP_0194035294 /NCGR_PEP_ID=MMETSP0009_2-20130614/7724_1 /TAXON_ID=210454 /ORGANISM="Grammatophora oceanica, Strain CCMP 410" /LENGTH=108 /DNA_ID=CAMNT_0038676583 /DNA_START=42 /DNA_END=365 /DNA_ORIENTATION=+
MTEINEYVDDEDDLELCRQLTLLKILRKEGKRIREFYEEVKRSFVPLRAGESVDDYQGVVLSTTHKAKGLEFQNVLIWDDFRFEMLKNLVNVLSENRMADEGNLLYVA